MTIPIHYEIVGGGGEGVGGHAPPCSYPSSSVCICTLRKHTFVAYFERTFSAYAA